MKHTLFGNQYLFRGKLVSIILLSLLTVSIFSIRSIEGSFSPNDLLISKKNSNIELQSDNQKFSSLNNSTTNLLYLDYNKILGKNINAMGTSIAVDKSGNSYITGEVFSNGFPTINAYNSTFGGYSDDFITKLNSKGNIDFSSYIGGSLIEYSNAIAVDNAGNSYIVGNTLSNNFPLKNAYVTNSNLTINRFVAPGNHTVISGIPTGFIAKFNSHGELVFSTYFSGNSGDTISDIVVDSFGNSYITGEASSSYFPIKNAYNATYGGNGDAFVAKFNASGSLIFSTYLGGSEYDYGTSITLDKNNNIFITGTTSSSNFPTKNTYNTAYGGNGDVFVAKFNTTGYLEFSTLLGGSNFDQSTSIGVDASGNSYITGTIQNFSSNVSFDDFPMKNAYNKTYGGSDESFVAKFSPNGTLDFSTYLGGSGDDYAMSIAVNPIGDCYVTGQTSSRNFPVKNTFNKTFQGYRDGFITNYNSTGNLIFSSYIDKNATSIAIDKENNLYLTGYNIILPFNDSTFNIDVFVEKFSTKPPSLHENSLYHSFESISKIITTNYIYIVLFSILLTSALIIASALEYKKYSKVKRDSNRKTYPSFKNFLKNQVSRKKNSSNSSQFLSDKTFELLQEIEIENSSEKVNRKKDE